MAPDERERRIAANEALFRSANDRIEDLNRSFETMTESGTWICECADPSCVERIRLPLDEYAEVRAHPAQFIIRRGHDLPDVEGIVAEGAEHVVVEKRAGVGRGAAEAAYRGERRDGE